MMQLAVCWSAVLPRFLPSSFLRSTLPKVAAGVAVAVRQEALAALYARATFQASNGAENGLDLGILKSAVNYEMIAQLLQICLASCQ